MKKTLPLNAVSYGIALALLRNPENNVTVNVAYDGNSYPLAYEIEEFALDPNNPVLHNEELAFTDSVGEECSIHFGIDRLYGGIPDTTLDFQGDEKTFAAAEAEPVKPLSATSPSQEALDEVDAAFTAFLTAAAKHKIPASGFYQSAMTVDENGAPDEEQWSMATFHPGKDGRKSGRIQALNKVARAKNPLEILLGTLG